MKKFFHIGLVSALALAIAGCGSSYPVNIKENFSYGNQSSQIVITEFSDYQCPACGYYHNNTFPDFYNKFVVSGRVKFVFRDFPLKKIHENAQLAAETSYCAADQVPAEKRPEIFLEYQKKIFASQNQIGRPLYASSARELNLDETKFKECVDAHTYKGLVDSGYNLALDKKLSGTPTLLVNNIHLPNQNNLEEVEMFVSALESQDQTAALTEAFKTSIKNNAALAFKQIAPSVNYDFSALIVPENLVADLVSRVAGPDGPVVDLEPAVGSILEQVKNQLISK